MNGLIAIDEKPKRILTISTGHDEMIFGFANLNNIVGVTSFSQSPGGNIYELTKDMPTITSEIETIVAQSPDIVFETTFRGSIPNLTPGEYMIQVHTKTIPENKCKTEVDDVREFQVSLS